MPTTFSPADRAASFLAAHRAGQPLLMPNPWDAGSARILAALGFHALATTSSGFAGTLGRLDGSVTLDEAIAHAADIAAATSLPVNADLENGFADDPAGVANTVSLAAGSGAAGCSIEDYTGNDDDPIYDIGLAVERIAAAAEAAHAGDARIVLTARAENFVSNRPDLADTISRLQRFQAAGADVVYAPGLIDPNDIAAVVSSVDVPVNVLALPSGPTVAELAALGVSRISVGGAFAYTAWGALANAAREFLDHGTLGDVAIADAGHRAAAAGFGATPS